VQIEETDRGQPKETCWESSSSVYFPESVLKLIIDNNNNNNNNRRLPEKPHGSMNWSPIQY